MESARPLEKAGLTVGVFRLVFRPFAFRLIMFEHDILPVKKRLLDAGVRRMGVFGSVARGHAHEASDVDVLVSFAPEKRTYDNLEAVALALEEAFSRRVDLVTEDALSPYLAPHILREVRYVNLGA